MLPPAMLSSAVTWLRRRARRRFLLALAALVAAPFAALAVAAALTELPPELRELRAPSTGVVLRDRHSVVIREIRADDGSRARWVRQSDVGERALAALVAAEDHRFYQHPGIDPLAIARAAAQAAVKGRVVSGASTLTQQLARNLVKRPRTLGGKLREMALALRIEGSLDKRSILEQYINRVAFGPSLRGIEAASRFYFDKPSKDLSLAEAAALASLPRGPSLYDPARGTERLRRRRDRVLDRMLSLGLSPPEDIARAKEEPLVVARASAGLGAPHLVRGLFSGAIDPSLGPLRNRAKELTLTIDRGLQRELEVLAQKTVQRLEKKRASAASIVVIDNQRGDILAYIGAPDIEDARRLGHNDGVIAARQPGSTLKPFLYELAMERLGFTAATALPDIELYLPTKDGDYHPNNYDGRFHGPVRLREALGNSYNVPAVWTAAALGPGRVLDRLNELGLTTLGEDGEHYGAAIALGDGEVRLLDLTNAYASLARGGVWKPVRALLSAIGKDEAPLALPSGEERRVMDEAAAYVITDILSDKGARLASFGEHSALSLPFPVAVKTGTSKGFRDNFTVGYTPLVTVGVWVGNFDGSPMEGVSGVSGAGPLFHDAMIAAMRGREPVSFSRPEGRIEEAEICSLSGERPGPSCEHRRLEIFAGKAGARGGPQASCSMHERAWIDRKSGLLAGPGCSKDDVVEQSFERYPAEFRAWARSAGRPVAPEAFSPRCPRAAGEPERAGEGRRGKVQIRYPPDGAAFSVDPGATAKQAIRIKVDVPPGVAELHLWIDGQARLLKAPFSVDLPLVPGEHRLRAEAQGASSEVGFEVE